MMIMTQMYAQMPGVRTAVVRTDPDGGEPSTISAGLTAVHRLRLSAQNAGKNLKICQIILKFTILD